MTTPLATSPESVGIVLIPGFALMCYASAVEPLRAANLLAGRELYHVTTFAPEGVSVTSSSGAVVPCVPMGSAKQRVDSLFVIAGGHPSGWNWPVVHKVLRGAAREGVTLGGISGGPYLLAAAGLLAGYRFTIHWEHTPALREAFPDLRPVPARYVVDRNRLTCGGGIAPLDMMHALIAQRHGAAFATKISDWYLHTHVGSSAAPQRASAAERHGLHHEGLLSVLEKMETTLEAPLDRSAMARFAGVSERHLDRLFATHLSSTFTAEYRRLRLEQARTLLQQSALTISEIAVACGYSTPAHFARSYRQQYGTAPSATRQR
ncbi:GlxA family transcriptional regulator [Ciceribacter sp. L1K23]|uniref:GlxA family transcriptional regulator n=1 Tax=Ciceribacter sp. L1K23 TaxID=2820276 RepID=UPI001B8241D6|nr:GlxA family transcriptional regulator [Ciceribacter sp. L1K23]MBR0557785.1 GlxA family transcriptional regulator [Ciceribacter sp. L1K23]